MENQSEMHDCNMRRNKVESTTKGLFFVYFGAFKCQTRIAHKVGLHVRWIALKNVIYQ